MKYGNIVALTLGFSVPGLAHPQTELLQRQAGHADRAGAVKKVFQTSWKGYYDNAFPHDNLHPLSNTYDDSRNGWGVTAVDALSTAIVVEDKRVVKQILDHIAKVDFTTTEVEDESISVFETNIRYLGGMISGYDLLKGPYKHLIAPGDRKLVDKLLQQSKNLADGLSVAFDTPSGVPDSTIILNPEPRNRGNEQNNIAEIGTMVLEWTRLSDLTGDDRYATLIERAEAYLLRPEPRSGEPFPGLVGTFVSTKNGTFLDGNGGWSGLTDSYYEYLIKMYLYDPKQYEFYKERWVAAADSTMKFLASHPTTRKDLTYLSQYSGRKTTPVSSHLASFAGGNFILGGILLKEEKYIKFGIKLAESYFNNYETAPAGIGPESFRWVDGDSDNSVSPPKNQASFYESSGWWASSPGYILRPETVESLYYAWRVTGDGKYQDMAWRAFQAITKVTKGGSAYVGISDVTQKNGGEKDDSMESFWLAETLKYMFLIFTEKSPVHVEADKPMQFVYNTEAHPIRVRGGQRH